MDFMEGRSERIQPEYGRMGNPTVSAVEKRLAALEGAERAVLFSSGMAAITTLFMTILAKGDHLILTDDCYKKTRLFADYMDKYGVETSIVEPGLDAVIAAIRPQQNLFLQRFPPIHISGFQT